ncbi:MAG: hypothetical protein ACE5HO_20735 [bacterium]
MKETWRKATAIFLTCALLFLIVAAEFSHQHAYSHRGPTTLTKSESPVDASSYKQYHSFVCLACLYGLSHLAPKLSFFTVKLGKEAVITTFSENTFKSCFFIVHFNLRAPPKTAA